MAVTNTLAYWEIATIMTTKCFIVKNPGVNLIYNFQSEFTHYFLKAGPLNYHTIFSYFSITKDWSKFILKNTDNMPKLKHTFSKVTNQIGISVKLLSNVT
jgi:hypothetical protein